MTSSEYKTSVGNVFDTACDELGMDTALAMQMAAILERIERRGYLDIEAMSLMRAATFYTSLTGTTDSHD